jgi:uncharacterized protein involved in propanediol utilization
MFATGYGTCPAHHGEVLQGMFHGPDGDPVHGVVSLPCPRWVSTATFRSQCGRSVTVAPPDRTKALRAALLAVDHLGLPTGGSLTIDSPIPCGRGLGSSTADVVSAIRAVAHHAGVVLDAHTVARLSVRAEGASDTVMFADRAVLYANRHGAVIDDYRQPLPGMLVVGFDDGRSSVETDALPIPPYRAQELSSLHRQRVRLRSAIRLGCCLCVARVASVSARINQMFRPSHRFPLALSVAVATGAAGYQSAHSGTVFGLLFDPDAPDVEQRSARARELLRRAGIAEVYQFHTTGPDGWPRRAAASGPPVLAPANRPTFSG